MKNALEPYTFYTRFLQKYCFWSEKLRKSKTYKSIENKGFYQIIEKQKTQEKYKSQLPLSPPKIYNSNLYPIGNRFGFIISIEEIEDW